MSLEEQRIEREKAKRKSPATVAHQPEKR